MRIDAPLATGLSRAFGYVLLTILAAVPAVPASAQQTPAGISPRAIGTDFVTRKGSRLFLGDREYRAIGVNLPHLHQAYFGTWFHIKQIYKTPEAAKQAMVDAILDAERSGLAFIRFFANPGYPRDIDLLYAKDPERYWKLMDELFNLCRAHHIRLVPSLNTIPGWHLYYGEVGQAILDPNSRTYQAVYQYLRDFVTRYKDDPVVLMWELTNEGMLKADVDMQGRPQLPRGVYSEGATVRETGVREDSLTWAMMLQLYKDQATLIKSLDPNHLVTSGDSHVRPECTSRRETFPNFKYRTDTLREWLANNLASQPEPLDVFSFHVYGSSTPPATPPNWGLDILSLLRSQARVVHATNSPLFVGELGQDAPSFQEDPQAQWTRSCIDLIEQESISLAALWVWHFPWQPDRTLTSQTHPLLVERAAQFNRAHGALEP
jgi:mannan endo-1,4-beta-mannosidase